jgi:menaquinone-dependent protoporphyrinogen oxidase
MSLTTHREPAAEGTDARRRTVLVVYASRHGATRGVASRIAARLGELGLSVDLCDVADAKPPRDYDAVVFGSPVYDQSWPPEAEAFVRRHLGALADRAVWLFSVGTFGDTRRLIGPLMTREPRGIADLRSAIQPREYRVFAGVIERHQWPLWSRVFFHALGGRLGDNRDWPEIDAWASSIGHALRTPA